VNNNTPRGRVGDKKEWQLVRPAPPNCQDTIQKIQGEWGQNRKPSEKISEQKEKRWHGPNKKNLEAAAQRGPRWGGEVMVLATKRNGKKDGGVGKPAQITKK